MSIAEVKIQGGIVKIQHSVVPTEMDGYIDTNEEPYFYTYYLLSYIKATNGELDKATQLLAYIQTRVNVEEGPDINFEEDLNVVGSQEHCPIKAAQIAVFFINGIKF
ncbi:hypothetical protein [Paenibacillus sp. LPE1-1-1.1]|uniref:hypothetical protein n=1 Tax=Paenibacillus sp. LPE1-1-1.1 TaxID=3135230 RepID=UPI00342BC632